MSDTIDIVGICVVTIIVVILAFATGNSVGRVHQCSTMHAEYHEGKCVIVTRTEVKL